MSSPAFTLGQPADIQSPDQILSPPCVAVRSDGTVLLVAAALSGGETKLEYAVGKINSSGSNVVWNLPPYPKPFQSTNGVSFSMAMNDEGLVVICSSDGSSLSAIVCEFQNELLLPFASYPNYDSGAFPTVAVNNQGLILELHASTDDNLMRGYYHCGTYDKCFTGHGTGLFSASIQFSRMIASLNDNNQCIVGYSGSWANAGSSDFMTGTVVNDQVNFLVSSPSPLGLVTSAVMVLDDAGRVLEVDSSDSAGIRYQTGSMNSGGVVSLTGEAPAWNAGNVSAAMSAFQGYVVVASNDYGAPRNFFSVAAGLWPG